MKKPSSLELLVYTLVIVLSVAALVMVVLSASQFTATKVVYQGF